MMVVVDAAINNTDVEKLTIYYGGRRDARRNESRVSEGETVKRIICWRGITPSSRREETKGHPDEMNHEGAWRYGKDNTT